MRSAFIYCNVRIKIGDFLMSFFFLTQVFPQCQTADKQGSCVLMIAKSVTAGIFQCVPSPAGIYWPLLNSVQCQLSPPYWVEDTAGDFIKLPLWGSSVALDHHHFSKIRHTTNTNSVRNSEFLWPGRHVPAVDFLSQRPVARPRVFSSVNLFYLLSLANGNFQLSICLYN